MFKDTLSANFSLAFSDNSAWFKIIPWKLEGEHNVICLQMKIDFHEVLL